MTGRGDGREIRRWEVTIKVFEGGFQCRTARVDPVLTHARKLADAGLWAAKLGETRADEVDTDGED